MCKIILIRLYVCFPFFFFFYGKKTFSFTNTQKNMKQRIYGEIDICFKKKNTTYLMKIELAKLTLRYWERK